MIAIHRFFRRTLLPVVILSLLGATGRSLEDIIPPERTTVWRGDVGVPESSQTASPTYKNIVTDFGADPTGASDVSEILKSALTTCPNGQAIYVPAGTYLLKSRVMLSNAQGNRILRGAGMNKTVFRVAAEVTSQPFRAGSADWPIPAAATSITSGATKGSHTVGMLSVPASAVVGNFVRIEQAELPWVKALNGQANVMSFLFRITAKTATTVTFTPPLPFSLKNSPKAAFYAKSPLVSVGFEDFTIDLANSPYAGEGIYLEQAYGCWIKGVEVKGSNHRQMLFTSVVRCEVKKCYIHDAISSGPNHEGIDLFQHCCFNLIENNILVRGGFPMIVLGDSRGGCSANVIAYNYCEDLNSGSSVAGHAISDNHGPHNMLNLIEGNVAQGFKSDGYFGSSSHGTILRNAFTGKFASGTMPTAIGLGHFATYYNILGNVLGDASVDATYSSDASGNTSAMIYRLGFPNMGNPNYTGVLLASSPPDYTSEGGTLSTAQKFDQNVAGTLIRHGNYDYATRSVLWEPSIIDRNIPVSMYLVERPSWWGAARWPAVDPTNDERVTKIPAQIRYEAIQANSFEPARVENLRITTPNN